MNKTKSAVTGEGNAPRVAFVKPPFGSPKEKQQYYCTKCDRNHHIFDWTGELNRNKRAVCGTWFDAVTKTEVSHV